MLSFITAMSLTYSERWAQEVDRKWLIGSTSKEIPLLSSFLSLFCDGSTMNQVWHSWKTMLSLPIGHAYILWNKHGIISHRMNMNRFRNCKQLQQQMQERIWGNFLLSNGLGVINQIVIRENYECWFSRVYISLSSLKTILIVFY
jgi:hypothetical protein